jgi:nicotinate-nucleotide pyrophosphorylase
MTGAIAGASLKTYNNSKVRAGEKITNPKLHAKGYEKWVETSIQKQIDKAKSDAGKKKYTDIQKEYVREVKKHTNNLVQIITFQNYLVDAKSQIVNKLNSVKGLTDTFIKTSNGFKVTNPEGYVAIDRVSGGAVKLVDRMEFSFNNFTAIKAWDK